MDHVLTDYIITTVLLLYAMYTVLYKVIIHEFHVGATGGSPMGAGPPIGCAPQPGAPGVPGWSHMVTNGYKC